MLIDTVKQDIIASLKRGDKLRAETMRFLLSAVRNDAIAKYGAKGESAMTDEDVLAVIKKQVKSHQESITAFTGAGRPELAEKETREKEILSSFLPSELSDAELSERIGTVLARTPDRTFGPLMGAVMKEVAGRADGKRVAALLKQALS